MAQEKKRLDDQTMALRLAREFQDGMVINLGGGIPTLACNYIPEGREVLFQSETGILGFGPTAAPDQVDWDLLNASGQPVTFAPGMSVFNHDEGFCMIRGGHIDLVVLGGLQVSEKGDLANWVRGSLESCEWDVVKWIREGGFPPSVGGAIDLATGAKKVIVAMTHTTKDGKPKIVKKCSYELTAKERVDLIITDVAVIEVTKKGLVLKEIAPGWTPADVQAITEPKLIVDPKCKEIEL